jgi:hypothetical protein
LDKPSGGSDIAGVADNLSERRHIWLCADDYGISTAVNVAIRDLVVRKRLNATPSCRVAPSHARSPALDVLNTDGARRHRPVSDPDGAVPPSVAAYRPARDGSFLSLPPPWWAFPTLAATLVG